LFQVNILKVVLKHLDARIISSEHDRMGFSYFHHSFKRFKKESVQLILATEFFSISSGILILLINGKTFSLALVPRLLQGFVVGLKGHKPKPGF